MRLGGWCSHPAAGSLSIRHPYNRAGHAGGQGSGDDGAQAQADHLGPPLGRHGSQAADHDSRTGGGVENPHMAQVMNPARMQHPANVSIIRKDTQP